MITIEEFKNSNIESFKIMKKEYAEHSFNHGEMYFSCASNYGKINKKGQGDSEEGLYARVYKYRYSYINNQIKKHGNDLLQIPNGNFVDLKLKSVINMPTFCLFSIKGNDKVVNSNFIKQYYLKKPKELWECKFKIDKELFLDFSGTEEKGVNSNVSVLHYKNLRKLIEQVKNSFYFWGYDKDEIINRNITYINRTNCEWICHEKHPYELFYKSRQQFEYQHENRIVLTDKKVNLIDEEKNKCFKLIIPNLKQNLTYYHVKNIENDYECKISSILFDIDDKESRKQGIKLDANKRYELNHDKMYFYISDMIK